MMYILKTGIAVLCLFLLGCSLGDKNHFSYLLSYGNADFVDIFVNSQEIKQTNDGSGAALNVDDLLQGRDDITIRLVIHSRGNAFGHYAFGLTQINLNNGDRIKLIDKIITLPLSSDYDNTWHFSKVKGNPNK